MTTQEQGARYHSLLLLNPHLSALIADGTFQGKCAERVVDLLSACNTTEEVQQLARKLPHVHFVDTDLGILGQFVA